MFTPPILSRYNVGAWKYAEQKSPEDIVIVERRLKVENYTVDDGESYSPAFDLGRSGGTLDVWTDGPVKKRRGVISTGTDGPAYNRRRRREDTRRGDNWTGCPGNTWIGGQSVVFLR